MNTVQKLIEKYIDKPWCWGKYGLSSNTFKFDYYQFKNKRKIILKNIIILQNEDWLWKPICDDGAHCIILRVTKKELNFN